MRQLEVQRGIVGSAFVDDRSGDDIVGRLVITLGGIYCRPGDRGIEITVSRDFLPVKRCRRTVICPGINGFVVNKIAGKGDIIGIIAGEGDKVIPSTRSPLLLSKLATPMRTFKLAISSPGFNHALISTTALPASDQWRMGSLSYTKPAASSAFTSYRRPLMVTTTILSPFATVCGGKMAIPSSGVIFPRPVPGTNSPLSL